MPLTDRGYVIFETEKEQFAFQKEMEAKGFQVAIAEHELMRGTLYTVSWRPMAEKGTRWTNRIPKL